MQTYSTLHAVIDYIDAHVEDGVDSDKLAEIGSFSKSHFFKLFVLNTGYTPMNYVLRRKLHFAAKRMISEKEKIVDIACRFGFESHDVFSRAFKRVYGVTPESYRRRRYTLPEMKKAAVGGNSKGGRIAVDVQIVERPAMRLLGVERRIGNAEGEATIGLGVIFSKLPAFVRPC